MVFFSRALKIADEALNLIRHLIERSTQFAQFRSPQYFYPLRKIAGCYALRARGEFTYGPG